MDGWEKLSLKNMLFQQMLKAIFIKQSPTERSIAERSQKMASQRISMEHTNHMQRAAVGMFNEWVSPPAHSFWGAEGLRSLIQGFKPGLNEPVEKKGKRFY